MSRGRKWGVLAIVAAAAVGATAPALADRGGVPNERSRGGIGRAARTLAARLGP